MTTAAPATPSPAARLLALAPTGLALVLLLVAGRWFAERWAAVVGAEGGVPVAWGWLVVAAACLGLHAASALVIWRQVLAASGAALPWRTAVDVFAPALLARYVPGRIWANAARLALGKRAGIEYTRTTGALVWETLLALASAGAVAALTLSGRVDALLYRGALGLVAAPVVVWLVLAAMGRTPRRLAAPAAVSLLGWLLFALAHLAVARAVAPVGLGDLPLVAGAMALAWAAGYLAIVVPVGLGVRDGILLVALASVLTPAQALMFVALARLVQLVVDAALTGAWLILRARRSPSPTQSA